VSRWPASSRAAAAALLWALAAPAAAGVRLEVGGAVEPAEDALMVRLDVTNRGAAAVRLEIEGEIFGHHARTALPGGVAAGAAVTAWLHFPVQPPRPGVHALALTLEYTEAGASQSASQRACLLLQLGAPADPALRVAASPASFETSGTLRVGVQSADGRAHDVRVRVLAPRGVNALAEPSLRVPPSGGASVDVPLIRTGPSRRENHEVIVVAATDSGGAESTELARAQVELVPHLPLLPRLRPLLAVAGALLLAAAVAAEVWSRWR
jgi:hypothetical protein